MTGDGQKPNWKDILYKGFWTTASAALSFAGVALLGVDAWWAGPAIPIVNSALAWVRQQLGATPPEAPKTTVS